MCPPPEPAAEDPRDALLRPAAMPAPDAVTDPTAIVIDSAAPAPAPTPGPATQNQQIDAAL